MDDKKAADVLVGLLNKYKLNKEEKEAVLTAIGVLAWTSLGKNKLKNLVKARKAKLDKSFE